MEERQVSATLEHPLAVEDQELFARVWNRVMPQQEHSPIALGPAQQEPCPMSQEASPEPEAAAPSALAPEQSLQPLDRAGQDDVPCLGASSMGYAPLLRELMEQVQGDAMAYQAMARRSQGNAARQLGAMAADQQRYLRQLGAVYFLLTGQRWQHTARPSVPVGGLGHALREMFVREQRARQAYANAGQEVRDPCLLALFQELSAETEIHMDGIRHILERM